VRVKDQSVSFSGVQPQILLVLLVAEPIWNAAGAELVITSANDGAHSETSLHYAGAAIDLRTHALPRGEVQRAVEKLGAALGGDFDAVLEDFGQPNEHCHVEWQPRRRR